MNNTEVALLISLSLLGFVGIYCILLWFRQRNEYTRYQDFTYRGRDDDPNN